tara:strand:+ start:59 stop:592 length:534 start_codon:yes stop_codon:yes gene_type:complete
MIKLLQALKDAGITAVIAGGAVRDQVRGVEPNDIDVWCLGDTTDIDTDVLLGVLDAFTAELIDVGDYDDVLSISQLVKGKFTDAQGKVRDVDIIVPAYHFNSPIDLVSKFDYNVNQGFIGLDCGVYKPDLTRLYRTGTDNIKSERTERFTAMVQYYNDQQSAAKAFKDNDAAWLEDT